MPGRTDSLKRASANLWNRGKGLLVRFAIETNAINDSAKPAHVRRLLERWERFGILVYPKRGDHALRNRISGLAPTARKLWKTAWTKVVKNNGNAYRWVHWDGSEFDWGKVNAPQALASSGHEFELAVLEDLRAADLGVPHGESRRCGRVEGIRLRDVDVSDEFSKARTLGDKAIDRGESIRDIWSCRFRRFAAYSRQVVIVDQYAVQNNNVEGILRLLRLLDADAKGCRVTVYSCLGSSGTQAARVEGRIRAEAAGLGGRGVVSVGVRLFRRKDFQRYAHDRHLRFDSSVFSIGRGMKMFEKSNTKEATNVHYFVLQPGMREQKELNLERRGKMVHRFRVRI